MLNYVLYEFSAMVISTKILNLLFKEKPNKIWVYWLGENTFSHVRKILICTYIIVYNKLLK